MSDAPSDPDRAPSAAEPAESPRVAARLARSAARLAAVQALYQMEIADVGAEDAIREFLTHRSGAEIEGAQYRPADAALFRRIVERAVGRQREIDQLTDAALVERWPLGRVDPTLRALFRAAGAELTDADGPSAVPPRVAITEYVDVAKAFFPDGREPGFANGVLDHMARAARPQAFGSD